MTTRKFYEVPMATGTIPPLMQMSLRGRQRLTDREGKMLRAYRDSVGVWTIGVGHTAAAGLPAPKKGMRITAEECDRILIADLYKFEAMLNAALKVAVTQNEFDALLSVMFNVGPKFVTSTAIKRLNAGASRDLIAAAILLWNKPPEIRKRRQTEASQFLTPYV